MFKKNQEPSATELHKKCLASTAIAQQKVDKIAPSLDAPNVDPLEGTSYDFRREFVGYGREPLNPKWPKNARIAVCFVINYEEVSPTSQSTSTQRHVTNTSLVLKIEID